MPASADTRRPNPTPDAGDPTPGFTPPPAWRPPTVPPDVTLPPPPGAPGPRGGRSGAVWVAGTGAFLLVAAAALFVAVRWSALPLSLKIAIVGGLTGAVLYAGAALRERLPGVAGVLTHLGAFLVPIDVGALTYRLGWDWDDRLLVEGLVGLLVFPMLARSTGSTVLRYATGVAAVATSSALGSLTPVPAPVILAVLAAGALALPDRRGRQVAVAASAVAGFGPILAAGFASVVRTVSLTATGWATTDAEVALATGLLAGTALLIAGRRAEDIRLALLGAVVALTGTAHALVLTELTPEMETLAWPAAFLVLEALVLLASRDRFYGRPARVLGAVVEVPGALGALAAAGAAVFVTPFLTIPFIGSTMDPERTLGAAFALLGAGWLLAWGRRALDTDAPAATWVAGTRPEPATATGRGRGLGSLTAAGWSAIAAVVFTTGSPLVIAVVTSALIASALAVTTVGSGSLLLRLSATGATLVLAGAVVTRPALALVFLLPAAVAVLIVAVRATLGSDPDTGARTLAVVVATPALLTVWAALAIASETVPGGWLAATGLVAAWAIALGADDRDPVLADAFRGLGGAVSAGVLYEPSVPIVAVPVLGVALAAADGVRLRERIAWAGVLPYVVTVAAVSSVAGLGAIGTAYAFGVAAIVAGAGAVLLEGPRRDALLAAAAASLGAALTLGAREPEALATLLLLAGGATAVTGVALRRLAVVQTGLALTTLGTWMRLTVDDVQALELYALPVSLMLVVAGIHLRRTGQPGSSWMTFAPAVAITGLPALVERMEHGSGWHAVAAGAVAVLGVALGGYYRQAGPLFTGTLLLLAVVGYEAFAIVAGVPTWAWLALGGSALLGTGIAMERADTSPVEATRRLIEVIDERFE